MICPLAPAHLVALGALQLFALLLPFNVKLAFVPLLAAILLSFLASFLPRFSFYLPIITRGHGRRGVALTFDDGPDPQVTPLLLDLLERHGVRATFFMTGVNAERYPDIVRDILARGHSIGNHSYSHSPFLMIKGRSVLEAEVSSAQRVLKRFGVTPRAFRPPVGITSPHLWRVLLQEGLYCVNFSCRAFDMGNRRVVGLSAHLLAKAAPGDIILLHDVPPRTGNVAALLGEFAALLAGLRAKGLEILPLDRLIGKEVMRTGEPAPGPDAAELFYDGLAGAYDREQFDSGVSIARRKELELFTARVPELFTGADRVLELGAGTGIFTLPIARRCREIVAVDISRNMLRILQQKSAAAGLSNIKTVAGDLEDIELEGTFPVVCAFSCFEYVFDLPALLRRLAGHVEPGGTLYFITARRSLIRLFARIGNAMRQGIWLKAYTGGEIESMLRAAGFEPREITTHLFKSWFSGGILLEVAARRDDHAPESVPATAGTAGAAQAGALPPKTLLVIPVYNHARMVRGVVERALAEGYPVMVVDDASTDGSLDAVAGLPIERRRLSVNRGKGAAILAGAAAAKQLGYDAILTIDADGQHDPADGRRLLEIAASNWPAVIIGARRMESGNAPRSSVFGRDFSNFWVRIECGQTIPDTQSGYRLYPVGYLTSGEFISERYPFEVEVLVRAVWAGLPVVSTPVSVCYPAGDGRASHFHPLKDNLRLSCLHAWLVARPLLPWPHRCMYGAAEKTSIVPKFTSPLQFFRRISQEHAGAGELAAAVWVGICIGALPIIPFGLATILYANHKLHLNKLAGIGASNVCVAPFMPLLCIEAGHLFLFGRFWTDFNRQTLLGEVHHRLWEWFLGALVVGPVVGTFAAFLTYCLVRRLRTRGCDSV
ncbi:MAG: DUF2062 domain-containing protein [Elusimicrobia bacterium]|nr:DUF2062 domain-containing protein [Elusimicrobiota bacterium]